MSHSMEILLLHFFGPKSPTPQTKIRKKNQAQKKLAKMILFKEKTVFGFAKPKDLDFAQKHNSAPSYPFKVKMCYDFFLSQKQFRRKKFVVQKSLSRNFFLCKNFSRNFLGK